MAPMNTCRDTQPLWDQARQVYWSPAHSIPAQMDIPWTSYPGQRDTPHVSEACSHNKQTSRA
jgi:hypothetical protein